MKVTIQELKQACVLLNRILSVRLAHPEWKVYYSLNNENWQLFVCDELGEPLDHLSEGVTYSVVLNMIMIKGNICIDKVRNNGKDKWYINLKTVD